MSLPEVYVAALEKLAVACGRYSALTDGGRAILVGGAATAILTGGAFMSGDFDVVAPSDAAFAEAMLETGFLREVGTGYLERGFYHPDHPDYGFEQVSSALFDGRADASRVILVSLSSPEEIALPSIEDMIADRLGQHAVSSPTDDSRLRQARALFVLAKSIDVAYLQKRIDEEGGDPALLGA
jgi:hypothetical protein